VSHGATGQEPEVGDEEFLNATRDRAHARALRKQLQQLAGGGAGGVLQEMSREILSGRVGLRKALRIPAYAEALGERTRTFRQAWDQMSPEERERHTADAQQFLATQQQEIAAEREERAQTATVTSRAAKHRGDRGWSLY
jgi:Sec-independent protein translocase protein TatA